MNRYPNFSSLQLFILVAKNLNFREAARLANISQPALSRTIRLLEEELGARLFDRTSRTVSLTAAGTSLLPIVERLMEDFGHALQDLRPYFAGERGRLVIGALPSVAADILPRAIARFSLSYPEVEILIHEGLAGVLDQQILDRTVDFAIGTPPNIHRKFAYTPLHEDPCVLVCKAGYTHFPDPAPWSCFKELPFIGMEAQSSVRQLTDRAFISVNMDVAVRYECSQLATVGGLIANGLGISLLPRSTLPLVGGGGALVWRSMEPPRQSRTIGIIQAAGRAMKPAASVFVETLQQLQLSDSDY